MDYKQAIVLRTDLKLEKGKLCSQAAHASLCAFRKASPAAIEEWDGRGQKKVVLKVSSLSELLAIYNAAKSKKLPACVITDAAKTQLKSPQQTALAIGPAPEAEIDRLTGSLKLL